VIPRSLEAHLFAFGSLFNVALIESLDALDNDGDQARLAFHGRRITSFDRAVLNRADQNGRDPPEA
jgi:hypothetical protein